MGQSLAENEQIPADYDVSDCENVFQRRNVIQPSGTREERPDHSNKMSINEIEKLKRDIDTIREAIRIDWLDLASKPLTVNDRVGLRGDIAALGRDLGDLIEHLDALPQ